MQTDMISKTGEKSVAIGVGAPGDVQGSAQVTSLAALANQNPRLSWRETAGGLIALIAWLGFFGAGAMISTQGFRDALLKGGLTAGQEAGYLAAAVACYTVTNLFFLACLASCLGCMSARCQIEKRASLRDQGTGQIYAAAVLRGFLFYTLIISGLLVVSNENTIVQTTVGQYVRLAGFVSALGFIVGYDPKFIAGFIAKVETVGNVPLGKSGQA